MEIVVVGYPKSGNTWLSRLLGSCLDSPVTGIKTAEPLCTEGFERSGGHTIRQLHLRPVRPEMPVRAAAIDNAWWYDHRLPLEDTKIVHIVRDVRDVIVSVFYYWQRETMDEAIWAVLKGEHPLLQIGPWQRYVRDWMDHDVITVKYETLWVDPIGTIAAMLRELQIKDDITLDTVKEAIREQSFVQTRARIEKDGDDRPYGKEVQLRNLRKGIIGDWMNHFRIDQKQNIDTYAGGLLMDLGYIRDRDWWFGSKAGGRDVNIV